MHTQLLEILVRRVVEVMGRPVSEINEMLADKFGAVNILEHLDIDYGALSRVIDLIERELDVVFPLNLAPGLTRDDLLAAMEQAVKAKKDGDNSSPEGERQKMAGHVAGPFI